MPALSLATIGSFVVWADVAPAPAAPRRPLLENSEFLVACALMALVLFGGAIVLSYFDRKRKRSEATVSDSASLMEQYREMYENGEITESEYHKVRARVAAQMKAEVGLTDLPKPPSPMPPDPPTP